MLEAEDGNLPKLAQGFRSEELRSPYTLCSVSHALRTELTGMRAKFPTACRLPYPGGRVITLEVMANIRVPSSREVIIHAHFE